MPKPDFREQFKRALAKIKQLKSELEVAQAQAAQAPALPAEASAAPVGGEPIAIVGMGCRFPGADSLEEFWSVLVEGQDRVVDIPDERVVHHWPAEVPRWAGLLDDVAGFDAEFFGISPREALKLDPQQRLALEVSWAALEHANLRPSALSGSNTGVFLGLCNVDYLDRVHATDFSGWEAYDLTGTISSTASGRIAYTLGLQGPTLTLDTACSSSLVAIHLAVNALRLGECDLALAGGSSVIASEGTQSGLYRTRALSADGRCKTFDASANGFVPGEGCGMLVLERLSDAQAKGHRVLAVVRGSAVNQDGRSTGLTAPNGLAQQSMLRAALRDAELEPDAISYIECHGTGTVLGDPIETDSLEAVFNDPKLRTKRPAERPDRGPLWLGAVKTNIGHLVAAAGVAGVIKTVLALEHDAIPPNLNLRHLNPRVRFEGSPLQPLRAQTPWAAEDPGQARYAGVSSFGMSGTNAHVIVGEAPETPETEAPEAKAPEAPLGLVPVLVSGRSRAALVAQAEQLRASLRARGELSPASQLRLAAALAHNRTHFEHRAALFADTPQALAEALERLVEGVDERGAPAASVVDFPEADSLPSRPKLAFLFTGQGSQRLGMGRELAATFPRFAAALDELCAALDPHLPRPLKSVLFAEPDTPEAALLDETGFTQPALFAVEVALFRLLESWGLRPAYLLGHSIGELAAAHVSGVFDLAAASALVAARARLMQALPKGGAMASVQASEAEVQAVLDDLLDSQGEAVIAIAGLNGPMSTVVAGDEAPVLATMAAFETRAARSAHASQTRFPLAAHGAHARRVPQRRRRPRGQGPAHPHRLEPQRRRGQGRRAPRPRLLGPPRPPRGPLPRRDPHPRDTRREHGPRARAPRGAQLHGRGLPRRFRGQRERTDDAAARDDAPASARGRAPGPRFGCGPLRGHPRGLGRLLWVVGAAERRPGPRAPAHLRLSARALLAQPHARARARARQRRRAPRARGHRHAERAEPVGGRRRGRPRGARRPARARRRRRRPRCAASRPARARALASARAGPGGRRRVELRRGLAPRRGSSRDHGRHHSRALRVDPRPRAPPRRGPGRGLRRARRVPRPRRPRRRRGSRAAGRAPRRPQPRRAAAVPPRPRRDPRPGAPRAARRRGPQRRLDPGPRPRPRRDAAVAADLWRRRGPAWASERAAPAAPPGHDRRAGPGREPRATGARRGGHRPSRAGGRPRRRGRRALAVARRRRDPPRPAPRGRPRAPADPHGRAV
ncbi:putative type I polyketide synthase [Plesiocystis pacifica SIR-1]|uniref:Putative type I polyketide synthase n=1 Tax=Plesiocystis pacifica SIR-1 TaxID=391625 RepID=A6GJX9_9BACT|nr:putative type I polyketide synthase [Plesiocystis pacifica SIR-1]